MRARAGSGSTRLAGRRTRLAGRCGALAEGAQIGDSIAINGCCLTVTAIEGAQLGFDLLEETQARTNLRDVKPGAVVNLERALPPTAVTAAIS